MSLLTKGTGGSSAIVVADGYHYQTAISDARVATGWTAGPNLHDGSIGDVTTGYTHSPSSSFARSLSWIVAKAAGMTFREIVLSPGFANTVSFDAMYGSNDLVIWTLLAFDGEGPNPLDNGNVFAYETIGKVYTNLGDLGPYRYICGRVIDTGGLSNEAGLSDIRILATSGGSDVGP